MTPDEFTAWWKSLSIPPTQTQLEATEVAVGSGVWIARDFDGRQHLLVRVLDSDSFALASTHGLSAAVTRHRIPGETDAAYIDIVNLDDGASAVFAVVAADIVEGVLNSGPERRRSRVAEALAKWRWFWGVDSTTLSTTDALGLFGELWFLIRWAGVSAESLTAWEASDGARHDFQWPERSVEVKTTSRAGAATHKIQNLEQLSDAETGQLYLYSLKVARDALAANTLNSLVDVAIASLRHHPEARSELLAKLGQRGYTAAGRDIAAVPYRIVEEALYRVAEDFPRLTLTSFRDGLPTGIGEVSYQLGMAACAPWRAAVGPDEWPPA